MILVSFKYTGISLILEYKKVFFLPQYTLKIICVVFPYVSTLRVVSTLSKFDLYIQFSRQLSHATTFCNRKISG